MKLKHPIYWDTTKQSEQYPEYIKNNVDLSSKISKISKASIKDGGEGAIYIFLKKNKEL